MRRFNRAEGEMLRAYNKFVIVLLLVNGTAAVSAERTVETEKNPVASSTSSSSPLAPTVIPIFDLRTAAPIQNIVELYDFRDYPMLSCGSNIPLCGSSGQNTPIRLFIAVPAENTVVSSYIQTWTGGYWSFSLNNDFTFLNLNVGMDW